MKKGNSVYLFIGICFLSFSLAPSFYLQAQDVFASKLGDKLSAYLQENPMANLHVHTDRNNYMPGDTVWFKAYMLSALESEVLYVRLTDDKKNIVLEKQFPAYDIRAHGDITLPDTLSDGKYFFYAYTDLMINFNPDDVFVQALAVKANTPGRIEMEAFVRNEGKIRRGEKVDIMLKVNDQGVPLRRAKGGYSLWAGNKEIKTGSINTNRDGESFISFTYPKIADDQSLKFEVKLNEERKYAELALNLRHEGNSVKVNAYPEGGVLMQGIPNNVVLEVLDDNDSPVSATLVLKEGERETDSAKTDANGIAEIRTTPKKGVHYSLEIRENGLTKSIDFPARIESEGFSLNIEKTKGNPYAVIYNRGKEGGATLVLRSLNQLVWSQAITLKSGDSLRVTLPVNDLPKGMLGLTLFDQGGNPSAERLFMNKQAEEENYRVQLDTLKQPYGKHDRITVNLNITDQQGAPLAANLSVAVVEKSTLHTETYKTILQSFYYSQLPAPKTLPPDNNQSLDAFLITKNWGNYDWRPILAYQPKDSITLLTNTGGVIGVIKAKEMIKERNRKPVDLAKLLLWSKSGPEIVPLGSNGYFSIAPEQLIVNQNEQKYLLLGKGFNDSYEIKFLNHSDEFDQQVKAGHLLDLPQHFSTVAKYERPVLKIFNSAIQLEEVVVSGRGKRGEREPLPYNPMGYGNPLDYVCINRILNCIPHGVKWGITGKGNSLPTVGYVYRVSRSPHLIVYNGPGKPLTLVPPGSVAGFLPPPPPPPSSFPIKEISLPNGFYLPDYSDTSLVGSDFRTTVFWTPNLNTDTTGKGSFEFYTSDIKSDYVIVVKGIDIHTLKPVYCTYDLKL